uniref:Uncharacterized protein TCIL3000_1_1780 n=1 Tax=Trypanosoma congolense (strain IL3000) TaxID=1068625 RepID=G0UJ60_TRYCI|nr:unnamed protein product [Trypanosoma congolense IL3000]
MPYSIDSSLHRVIKTYHNSTISSAICNTSSSCVAHMTPRTRPLDMSSRQHDITTFFVSLSNPAVGSSSRSTPEQRKRARASISRCSCPKLSLTASGVDQPVLAQSCVITPFGRRFTKEPQPAASVHARTFSISATSVIVTRLCKETL